MSIASKVRLFNAAYKIAWDKALEKGLKPAELAGRINDSLRVQMKNGPEDPAALADEVVKRLS